jgi:hypothetical protein
MIDWWFSTATQVAKTPSDFEGSRAITALSKLRRQTNFLYAVLHSSYQHYRYGGDQL